MAVLLSIIGLLILGLAYVLFTPLNVYVLVKMDGHISAVSGIKLFPFEYKFKGAREKARDRQELPKTEFEEEKKKAVGGGLSISDLDIAVKIILEFLRFAGRTLKAPDRYYLDLALAGGTGQPDITGQLFGTVQALRPVLPGGITISYAPDFMSEKLTGRVTCGVIVRIINILMEILRLTWRLPKLQTYRLYRRIRKGGGHAK